MMPPLEEPKGIPRPQAIIFDCGNTILMPSIRIVEDVLAAVQQQQWAKDLTDALGLAADMHTVRVPRDTSSEPFYFWWRILSGVPDAVDDSTLRKITSRIDLYSDLESSAIGVFKALKLNSIKIGIVTNAEGQTSVQMEKYGLDKLIDIIVDSDKVGIRKPNKGIYEIAANRLKVDPADCWFIGDSLFNDILGPSKAGVTHTLLYDPSDLYIKAPVNRISNLREILEILSIMETK